MASDTARLIVPINANPRGGSFPGPTTVRRGTQVPANIDLPSFSSLEAKLDHPQTPFVTGVSEDDGYIVVHTRQSSFRIEDLALVEKRVVDWLETRTQYGAGPAEIVF